MVYPHGKEVKDKGDQKAAGDYNGIRITGIKISRFFAATF